MRSTLANPGGFTTIGEEWDYSGSQNHMILAQIESGSTPPSWISVLSR